MGLETVIVLGSSGFIGSELVKVLCADYRVYGIGRRDISVAYDSYCYIKLDLFQKNAADELANIVNEVAPICIVNCVGGGYVSTRTEKGKDFLIKYNLQPLELLDNVLSIIAINRKFKLVHIGSVSSYGVRLDDVISESSHKMPKTPHEWAKYHAEEKAKEICSKYDLPWVILQPSQVYGGGDKVSDLYKLLNVAVRYRFFPIIGNGDNYMVPLVYVRDVCRAIKWAIESNVSNEEFLLAWERISWNEFGDVVRCILPSVKVLHIPFCMFSKIVKLQEKILSLFHREPFFSLQRLPYLVGNRLYDSSKFLIASKLQPTQLFLGLKETLADYGFI